MITGKKIAQEIRFGNLDVFQEFYQCYFKRLHNYAVLFTNKTDIAEDIVQEAFFKIWDKRDNIDCNQSITGLIYKTVRNSCINSLQKQKTHQKFVNFALQFEAIDNLYKIDFDVESTEQEDQSIYAEIQKAIDQLPEKRREVFVLSKLDGQSHAEIAKNLEITPKGVERHITLANKNLKTKLKHLKTAILILTLCIV